MNTALAIERDPWAAVTYRANFPDVEVWERDVRECLADLRAGQADIVTGGPPCTPFSPGGQKRGTFDPNDCVPAYVDAVARVQPCQFLLENVPRMLAWYPDLLRDFERLGYHVEAKYFDAADFGVPQRRNRVWVWGIRGDVRFVHAWPDRTHRPAGRTRDLFAGDLEEWVSVGEALSLEPAGRARRIEGAGGYSGQRILDLREPAPTMTSAANPEFVETPEGMRRMTVAECMRVMSGPDDFRWPDGIPKERQLSIVGNGWPSLLAWHMRWALWRSHAESRTVLDLFAGGGLGACGFAGRFWHASREAFA